jgi:hypothetical protein
MSSHMPPVSPAIRSAARPTGADAAAVKDATFESLGDPQKNTAEQGDTAAFSRTGDPSIREVQEAVILAQFEEADLKEVADSAAT